MIKYCVKWSDVEHNYIKDNLGKVSPREMAANLQRTLASVRMRIVKIRKEVKNV